MESYRHITVEPLGTVIGAEIGGVRLAEGLPNATIEEIRAALLQYGVIFFRDQHLSPDEQLAFARRFGPLEQNDFVAGMAGYPELLHIVKEAGEAGENFGGRWHHDVSYQQAPSLGSVLCAVDVPERGGDTLFANQYTAYETLTPGMQRLLRGLRAIHSPAPTYGRQGRAVGNYASMQVETTERADSEEVAHPVVRTHPETGRPCLFLNSAYTLRFEDMSEAESAPLLGWLLQHATQPAFTCRFRWTPGTVAFWDNRCVQHYALNDYNGHRREMRRATIAGDVPR